VLEQTTTVATPRWTRAAVWSLLPMAGAGVAWLLRDAADWAVRVPWPVMRGPLRLIADLPEPQATVGVLTLGAVLGLVLAYLVDQESLTVRVSHAEIELRRPGMVRVVSRPEVTTAYRDGDRLVLLDGVGRELAREPSHLSPSRLAALFAAHRIVWSERDPYADAYRRWVPDLPDVPAAARAVFAARQKALDRRDADDTAELRTELGRLGFVVRDDHKRQHWRRTPHWG
jgi:hypothetical protein